MESYNDKTKLKMKFDDRTSRINKMSNRKIECVAGVDGELAHSLRSLGVVTENHLRRVLSNCDKDQFFDWMDENVGASKRQSGKLFKSLKLMDARKKHRKFQVDAFKKRNYFESNK